MMGKGVKHVYPYVSLLLYMNIWNIAMYSCILFLKKYKWFYGAHRCSKELIQLNACRNSVVCVTILDMK